MNKIEAAAHEEMVAHEVRLRRPPIGYGPRAPSKPAGTWAPKMTEQQQQKLDQYIREQNLPF